MVRFNNACTPKMTKNCAQVVAPTFINLEIKRNSISTIQPNMQQIKERDAIYTTS
jgi:hypothetical protein